MIEKEFLRGIREYDDSVLEHIVDQSPRAINIGFRLSVEHDNRNAMDRLISHVAKNTLGRELRKAAINGRAAHMNMMVNNVLWNPDRGDKISGWIAILRSSLSGVHKYLEFGVPRDIIIGSLERAIEILEKRRKK